MEFEYVSLVKFAENKYNVVCKQTMYTDNTYFTDRYNNFLEKEINNILDDDEILLYKLGVYKIVVGHPVDTMVPTFILLKEKNDIIKMVKIDKKWYKQIRDII